MSAPTTGPHQAVIFDLDGTLVDSAKGIAGALNRVRAGRGLGPVALADVKRWVSHGAEQLVTFALDSTPASAAADLAAFRTVYANIPADPADLFPGALETVDALHGRGFHIGICTNKPQTLAVNIVKGLGLGPFVAAVVGGAPDLEPKPDPAPLHRVMYRLGTVRDQVLYVGDSEVDAETAQSAGVAFVLVGHGYVIGPREEIQCAALIDELSDLLQLPECRE
jgi:phosphoglycolate phosphatase